jgi:hypothetical protein
LTDVDPTFLLDGVGGGFVDFVLVVLASVVEDGFELLFELIVGEILNLGLIIYFINNLFEDFINL